MPVSKIGTGRYWTDRANRNGGDPGSVAIGAQFFDIHGDPTSATAGPDVLNGTGSDDTIDGLAGDDVIHGLGGNDTLIGGADNDSLFGDDGNDILTGGTGADIMTGGIGDDSYDVDIASDQVIEAAGEGSDTVRASVNYALAAGVEVELLSTTDSLGTAAIGLTGNEFGQTIIGNAGANFLAGGGGADILNGGAGNDVIIVDADDQVVEAVGGGNDLVAALTSYALNAGAEVETLSTTYGGGTGAIGLTGNEFGQTLIGNAGNNFMDGGGGADILNGGAGNDTLIVDANDFVIEAVGGGNDLVAARNSFALNAGAEVETLMTVYSGGTEAIGLTGNAFGQTLIGNAGNNFMDGGGGADILNGGAGDDVIIVDADDQVVEAVGGGNDLVGARTSYVLNAGAEVETLSFADSFSTAVLSLTGNEFGQTLIGNAGRNTLDGGGGSDILMGGGGDDTYFVDPGAQVIEGAGAAGGNDTVRARTSYVLNAGANVETLATPDINGTAAINLTGNELGQTLVGNAGNNVLDGGGGPDFLVGGAGNDTLIVHAAGDRLSENVGGGNDLVAATTSYALASGIEVETLSTTDSSGTLGIGLTGNAFAQTLIGNAGDNFLDGGAGADILQGLGGNDTYIVDNAGDQVLETAGGGNDLVAAWAVSYVLNAGAEVETLSTVWSGGSNAINLTGNEFAQLIIGNAANNILNGGLGADSLQGLGGADTFAFTTALGGGNVDAILDFVHGTDKIALDDAIFGAGIGTPGAFNANAFVTGTTAGDADDRIIYNSATGELFYDADGTGGIAQVLFATLQGTPALPPTDFVVI